MNSASRVLTVSYGTFSCSLEGFEDPFKTMTAIVEYFQKLAQSDRHFGAEPLRPELETLRNLAAKDLAAQGGGKVEAAVLDEDRFILRRQEELPQAAVIAADLAAPAAKLGLPAGVVRKLAKLRLSVFGMPQEAPEATPEETDEAAPLEAPTAPAPAAAETAPQDPAPKLEPLLLAEPLQLNKAAFPPEAAADLPLAQPPAVEAEPEALNVPAEKAALAEHEAPAKPETLEAEAAERAVLVESVQRARARVIRIRRRDLGYGETAGAAAVSGPITPATGDHPAPRIALVAESAQDFDRLMDQAEAQMEAPATQRRMASILHLKAAVAASAAEDLGQKTLVLQEPVALQPAAPAPLVLQEPLEAAQSVTEVAAPEVAPEEAPQKAAAPFVLMPDLRIDTASEAAVSEADPQPQPAKSADDFEGSLLAALESEDFAPTDRPLELSDYLAKVVPQSLTDYLALAAAYLTLSKDQKLFERADLMQLAGSLCPEPPLREDLLRAFGTLLRQGELRKAAGGQYRLAEEAEIRARLT